ncbi:MAG: hypothetical protein WBD41_07730 [Rhodococcus sp. (in: high G+C Gram-positive bacteria)]
MEQSIVSNGVVDVDALDTAVETDSQDPRYTETDSQDPRYTLDSLPAQQQKLWWWEYPTMGLVGALLGAAVYFSAVAP